MNTQFTMYVMCLQFLTNMGDIWKMKQLKSSIWVDIRCIKLEVRATFQPLWLLGLIARIQVYHCQWSTKPVYKISDSLINNLNMKKNYFNGSG